MTTQDIQQQIHDLEDQTWKALSKSGERLLPYLSTDCIFLFPLGMKVSHKSSPDLTAVMTSEAFIPWKTYEMKDVEVTSLGPDAAVITYNAIATRPGGDRRDGPFRALISSTWRKDPESGQYKLCVHQQTPYVEDLRL